MNSKVLTIGSTIITLLLILCYLSVVRCDTYLLKDNSTFGCQGQVYFELVEAWNIRNATIQNDLKYPITATSDLYYMQSKLSAIVDVSRRCGYINIIHDISMILLPSFQSLTLDKNGYPQWLCTSKCGSGYENQEKLLDVSQFMGILSHTANTISRIPKAKRTVPMESVLLNATYTCWKLLVKYSLSSYNSSIITRIQSEKPTTPTSNPHALLDKDTWLLTTAAELSGVFEMEPTLFTFTDTEKTNVQKMINGIIQLFTIRVNYQNITVNNSQIVEISNLDEGRWKYYVDYIYAGYNSTSWPLICYPNKTKVVFIEPSSVPYVTTLSLDISHATRHVTTFSSLLYNRAHLLKFFNHSQNFVPTQRWVNSFGNNMALRIWNGDYNMPKFSNYWDGTNGWYRAYPNLNECSNGTAPFGLSNVFYSAGYFGWPSYNNTLLTLAKNVYQLMKNKPKGGTVEKEFLIQVDLSDINGWGTKTPFWASLIGVNDCSYQGLTNSECNLVSCNAYSPVVSKHCSMRGNCAGLNQCNCEAGSYGEKCQYVDCFGVSNADSKACSGNGNCTALNVCSCSKGYFGSNCQLFNCFGVSQNQTASVCSSKGVCIAPDKCKCNGSFGNNCEIIGSSNSTRLNESLALDPNVIIKLFVLLMSFLII